MFLLFINNRYMQHASVYCKLCAHTYIYVITEIEHGNVVKKYEVNISMH